MKINIYSVALPSETGGGWSLSLTSHHISDLEQKLAERNNWLENLEVMEDDWIYLNDREVSTIKHFIIGL